MAEPRVFTSVHGLRAAVGERLGYSDWLEVDQGRIDLFADATGDHQWIHVDRERAASGPFGTTVAHGYLTLSLLPVLTAQVMRVEGADGRQLRHGPGALPRAAAGRVAGAGDRRGEGGRGGARRGAGDRRGDGGAGGRRQTGVRRRAGVPLLLLSRCFRLRPGTGPRIPAAPRALGAGPHHAQDEVGVERADLVEMQPPRASNQRATSMQRRARRGWCPARPARRTRRRRRPRR